MDKQQKMQIDRKALAMVIKSEREIADITQPQMATRVGIATRTLRNYESGAREPNATQLRMIAEVLGRTVDELFKMADARLADPVTRELLLAGFSAEDAALAEPPARPTDPGDGDAGQRRKRPAI